MFELSYVFLYREKDLLIVVTKTSFLHVYRFGPERRMDQLKKVKLTINADGSTTDASLRVCWIGDGLVATSSMTESAIKFWDLDAETNYIIPVPSGKFFEEFFTFTLLILFSSRRPSCEHCLFTAETSVGRHLHDSFLHSLL